jgi:hypothetical protein
VPWTKSAFPSTLVKHAALLAASSYFRIGNTLFPRKIIRNTPAESSPLLW